MRQTTHIIEDYGDHPVYIIVRAVYILDVEIIFHKSLADEEHEHIQRLIKD